MTKNRKMSREVLQSVVDGYNDPKTTCVGLMGMIDSYVRTVLEEKIREIPAPALRWDEHHEATPFKYFFHITSHTLFDIYAPSSLTKMWRATVDGGEIGEYKTEQEALDASQEYFRKEIWEKEMGSSANAVMTWDEIGEKDIQAGQAALDEFHMALLLGEKPAKHPFAGIDLDCEHFEDLGSEIMEHPIYMAYWNGVHDDLDRGASIWDAFRKWAKKWMTAGNPPTDPS